MNPKDQREYFIYIEGQKVPVSEAVYRAYKRPVWMERKRRIVRADRERSLDALLAAGMEFPNTQTPVSKVVEDKLLLDMALAALAALPEDERSLIIALFFEGKTERALTVETGLSKTGVHKQKIRILDKLKKIIVSE